jgi:multiple sugar transport system substrate-binding protein
MKRFKTVVLWAVLLSVVFAGAPVLAADKPLQLTLWHMEARPTRMKAIEDLLNQFNQENPDLHVNVEVQSWGDVYVKAVAAIQSGKHPDFIFSIPDFGMNLMLTRTIRPVDDVVAELQKKYHIYDQALAPYNFDKHFWAVPLYGQSEVLWYRKDLFEKAGLNPNKPPKTWSELRAAAKTLVDKGVVKYPIAVPGDWHLATVQQVYPLMVAAKAEHILDTKGNVVFDNQRTVEAFAFYKQLYDMSPPGSASWQWDQPIAAFTNGEVAMVIEKGQYIEQWDLRTKLPPEYLGAAPIPVPDKVTQPGTSYYSNAVQLLKSDPKVKAAYRRFVMFLYEPENMAKLLGAAPGLFLPVTVEASKAKGLLSNPSIARHTAEYELMIEQAKYGKLYGFTQRPYHPNIGRIAGQNLIAWTAQRMIFDNLTPEQAVKMGADKMREALD